MNKVFVSHFYWTRYKYWSGLCHYRALHNYAYLVLKQNLLLVLSDTTNVTLFRCPKLEQQYYLDTFPSKLLLRS